MKPDFPLSKAELLFLLEDYAKRVVREAELSGIAPVPYAVREWLDRVCKAAWFLREHKA